MNTLNDELILLKSKIMEERIRYILQFNSEPKHVIIPAHYGLLLETDKEYLIGPNYDTYYGMQVIASKRCTIEDVKVY